jgi:hypothetical protein
MKTIRLGAGAGYAGDRIEPAVELAEKGDIQYLVFECLAERTIALAQQAKMKDPASGYDPLLTARMKAVLGACKAKGIKVITNMGAANPLAAAEKTREIARALGVKGLKIAAVTGDDVLDAVKSGDYRIEETGGRVNDLGNRLSWGRACGRGARGRRRRGHHRPDRRSGSVPGPACARVRLGDGRLGHARARDGRGPPA